MTAIGLCLSTVFTTGGLLADRDGDGLPDALRARLAPGPQAQQPEHLAMVDLAARLGFEALALPLPLVALDAHELAGEAIPLFVGRPATLSAICPAGLRAALERLQPGEGLIATSAKDAPALLVGGADTAGLAAATRMAAQLPWLQAGHDLAGLRQRLRAACGDVAMDLVVEALLTRQGWVTEAHLRATLAPAGLAAAHAALATIPDGDALPCDLVITLDAGEDRSTTLRIAGPAQREAQASWPADAPVAEAPLRTLAGLYGPAGLAVDRDGDLLPESPRSIIVLPDDLSPPEAAEAAQLGARLGLETLGLALPLAYPRDSMLPAQPGGVAISVEPLATAGGDLGPGEGELRLLEADQGGTTLRVRGGDARGRAAALRELAHLDAMDASTGPAPTLEEWEQAVRRLCALVAPGARACAALAAVAELPATALAPSSEPLRVSAIIPELRPDDLVAVREQLSALIAARAAGVSLDVTVASETAESVIFEEAHRLVWEVDDAWARFESEVLPALAALPSGQRDWLLDVRLSEPPGRRRQIKREMLDRIRAAGLAAGEEQVRVLPAYWQGRTWLLEEVAPRLRGRDVDAITVRVQRFEHDYPCLELPIRWLQDLHSVDELLGAELGLPHQAIRFELVEQPSTYEVEARDADGRPIWRDTFDVIHGARPYLHGFPDWGTVHPPTGCVRLLVQGVPVVDARVAPDPERAWDLVQASLLPRLRAHVMAMTRGRPRPDLQPFFGSLTVEAWLSEEDSALGLREERVSPLESLHEDLYFMLLDYCSALMGAADEGEPYRPPWVRPRQKDEPRRGARMWTAPGPVLPYIHRADGAGGRLRFRLTAPPDRTTALAWTRGPQSDAIPCQPAPEVAISIAGLRLAPVGPRGEIGRRLLVELDGPSEQQERAHRLLAAWAALRAAGVALDMPLAPWSCAIAGDLGDEIDVPALPVGNGESSLVGGDEQPSEEASAPWDRVLGLADVERSLRALARSPRVRAYQAGRSARGRSLYAVELTPPRQGGLWSRAKLSAWKCTLLLNARHHANETSSTSALLRLAELLAHDAAWSRYLDRVNVVLIPYENADGAALHYALQEEHPTWMLHAGRYNDAGLEFIAEYSNPLTRHSEALVLPALWRRWAPDITCDDHGFPAHEWVQPFAGHCNPWFRSHWISQGLIYLIIPRIANPRYAQHRRAADNLQRRLVSALAGDPAVRARNSAYADRYRTFLSDWLPDEFPAPFEDDVLTHGGEYDPDDPARASSLASLPGRYPGVTTASLITEVADETAQGRYMALCAHTHLLANRVMLQYLYDANAPAAVQRDRRAWPGGRILLRAVRPRPVVAGPEPSPVGPVVDTP